MMGDEVVFGAGTMSVKLPDTLTSEQNCNSVRDSGPV